jgi:hypothetical protein
MNHRCPPLPHPLLQREPSRLRRGPSAGLSPHAEVRLEGSGVALGAEALATRSPGRIPVPELAAAGCRPRRSPPRPIRIRRKAPPAPPSDRPECPPRTYDVRTAPGSSHTYSRSVDPDVLLGPPRRLVGLGDTASIKANLSVAGLASSNGVVKHYAVWCGELTGAAGIGCSQLVGMSRSSLACGEGQFTVPRHSALRRFAFVQRLGDRWRVHLERRSPAHHVSRRRCRGRSA